VIVPVRNEEKFVAAVLHGLMRQHYPQDRFEVIVADGESTDATVRIVTKLQHHYQGLKLVRNKHRWSSAGRNAAIAVARGEIILLVDGHCELRNTNYLAEVAQAFVRSQADCLGRPQPLEIDGATVVQRAIALARASALGHNPGSHIYSETEAFVRPESVAVAYRRYVFDRCGQFDEYFDACEDVEFNHRVAQAGFRCFFTPAIKLGYAPRASLRGVFRQMARYGRGRVRLLRKHPQTFSLACFLPAIFLMSVIAGLPAALLWPSAIGVGYACMLASYVLSVLLMSVRLSWQVGEPQLLYLLPFVYGAIHLGAGVGVVLELLVPLRQSQSQHRSTMDQAANRVENASSTQRSHPITSDLRRPRSTVTR
jgi:succinoglycan biosynthesis protein ExoA